MAGKGEGWVVFAGIQVVTMDPTPLSEMGCRLMAMPQIRKRAQRCSVAGPGPHGSALGARSDFGVSGS